MKKRNCWEFMKCGREPGGSKVSELGVCPAADEKKMSEIHGGKNSGRCCWVVAGTFCEGKVQGVYAEKIDSCLYCDFYRLVKEEEGKNFLSILKLLEKFKES